VVDRRGARSAVEQHVDGLLSIEDATGAAELLEIIGEQRYQGSTVDLAVGVEEPLLEGVKMVL